MDHVSSPGHRSTSQPVTCMGQDVAGAPEQPHLSGKGQCLERGIEVGRDSPDQLLLCAALSVECHTWRGRRDGRRGSCLGFAPLWAATHGPCPPTPCRDIHSAFHTFFLPFMKELFTGAVSTQEMTWFLHSGRNPNSQTSFQLEGNTTHELGTPSVSLAITVCLSFGKKKKHKSASSPCFYIYVLYIYIYIKI